MFFELSVQKITKENIHIYRILVVRDMTMKFLLLSAYIPMVFGGSEDAIGNKLNILRNLITLQSHTTVCQN